MPSELSGDYHIKFLDLFAPYMNGYELKNYDSSEYRVRFLIDDSLQYSVSVVPKLKSDADSSKALVVFKGQARSIFGKKTNTAFRCKTKNTRKGLRFSHNPNLGEQHTILALPVVEKRYLVLNKDIKGNLIIRNGQRGYFLFFFIFPSIIEEYDWISIGIDSISYSSKRIKQRF